MDGEDELNENIRQIKITLQGFTNITPTYSVSDLVVQASHQETNMGESEKVHVIDDDFIPAHYEFFLNCDISSDVDKLISNPVILSVTESVGEIDRALIERLKSVPKGQPQELLFPLSADSAADLLESFTGKITDKTGFVTSTDTSGTTTPTKGGKPGAAEKVSEMDVPTVPVFIGMALLDLVPLFQGQTQIKETLVIHKLEKVYDDNIIPANIMPRVLIQVDVKDDWLATEHSNIFSLTIESIYNIPELMTEEMQYKVSTSLPYDEDKWDYVVIKGGKHITDHDKEKLKIWPGVPDNIYNFTAYKIDDCTDTIRNDIEANLNIINSECTRIQWNMIKRNYLKAGAISELVKKFKKFRRLPLEIYVTTAQDAATDTNDKAKKAPSPKGKDAGEKTANYLHLMALVDVSKLLYPGISRCRAACALHSYHEYEMLKKAGQTVSYFVKPDDDVGPMGGKAAAGKSDKASSKGPAKPGATADMKALLPPPPPPPPEPSKPVYNENGQRTFIIVEVELLKPLMPKRTMEDLSSHLSDLIPQKPELPKLVVSSHVADMYYKNVLKQLMADLAHQHQHYVKQKQYCECGLDTERAFVSFLQRSGAYHIYSASVTKAASVYISSKFPNKLEKYSRNSKEYQNFIASIYCCLVKDMHKTVNELTNTGAENLSEGVAANSKKLLFYAKEATALGASLLANRYYLERICMEEQNETCWFDYGVFFLEIGEVEKAIECTKKCLTLNNRHHHSLLLYGILLEEKKQCEEAETCLLTTVFLKPDWMEAWGVLYLFYNRIGNIEGVDLCLEMANKYLDAIPPVTDDFYVNEDLAWTASICPNTIFFRTALLLIKMRALRYAEKALSEELIKHPGPYHYYLAVIMYCRRNYIHALIHLDEAEQVYGLDYAIASLMGHCFLALGKLEKAKEKYTFVQESYHRPDDMHLVYVFFAVVLDRLQDKQAARKLLLLTCKFSPTPYTWLSAGILYYGQRDLLSAEQCLVQANLCDNRLPEIWGYLTLINLELERYNEADLCYKQAQKNNIKDPELKEKIERTMNAVCPDCS